MSRPVEAAPQRSNSYSIFMLVLTVMSLAIMVLLLLPLDPRDAPGPDGLRQPRLRHLPGRLRAQPAARALEARYFIGAAAGWTCSGRSRPSAPSNSLALLRLARLFRLARIARLLQGQNKKELVEDVVKNRGQYATFITMLLAFSCSSPRASSSCSSRAARRTPTSRPAATRCGGRRDHHHGGLRRLLSRHRVRSARRASS